MFTDPQSVTINAIATSLARVAQQGRSSVYESADGALKMTISHANGNRARSVVRFDRKKVGADALNPATNKQYTSSVYLVVDVPHTGFTDVEIAYDVNGLCDLVQGTGWIARFLGQES